MISQLVVAFVLARIANMLYWEASDPFEQRVDYSRRLMIAVRALQLMAKAIVWYTVVQQIYWWAEAHSQFEYPFSRWHEYMIL